MNYKWLIAQALEPHTGCTAQELLPLIETPPKPEMGDYALPCFSFAKTMRKAPNLIAQELREQISMPAFISKVKVESSYLNFFIDPKFIARDVMEQISHEGKQYGSSLEGVGKTVCIDYSSINIAKPFHIGHLSSTAIGHALYNIYGFLGYKTVGINHLGDWGTQFGKLIVAYKQWGDRKTIEKGGVRELLKIYVRFHDEADKDDSLNDAARNEFKKIEDGNEEALSLFAWFKEVTLREVNRIYDMLGIKFDSYAGESFYNDKMDRVLQELRAKKLLVENQGAYVVEFPEEDKMPPCLLLKADGATLYATRDIAAALYRKDTYDFYKCLYVVAYQQNLHFKQFFKVINMMGYDWAKDMEHVAFGMVSMEDGTLATRKGRVIFLEEVFDKAIEKAKDLIKEKSPELENTYEVAKQVGLGALIYQTLSASRIKDIVFSWDRALNFDGETGPYCQYTHARASSVLRKAEKLPETVDYSLLVDSYSQVLLKLLAGFPDAVKKACHENEPFIITRQVTQIAQAYNKFYFENRILDAPDSIRDARISLTYATKIVISTGLSLLGIESPDRM